MTLPRTKRIAENIAKTEIFTATIVEPTGVPAKIEIKIPRMEQTTDKTAAHIVTDLKVLKMRIADIAGNMTNAEMSNEPTRFIARTMIKAMMIAMIRL